MPVIVQCEDKRDPTFGSSIFLKFFMFSEVQLMSKNQRRMKTGLTDKQTSIVSEHVWNKRHKHRGFFFYFFPPGTDSHSTEPLIQPDSPFFSSVSLVSLCLASYSVSSIFFFSFYSVLMFLHAIVTLFSSLVRPHSVSVWFWQNSQVIQTFFV